MAFDRRRLLQMGGLALTGLGLPELLQAGAASSQRAKSCIFIVQYGGGPHHDTFDPKPDAPREIRGYYQPIATSVPGTQISEKLPLLAARAHRYCLIRSMSHNNGGHNDGMHVCLSGQSNGANSDDSPYFGSTLARLKPSAGSIPSYVWVQNLAGDVGLRYEGGGSLGSLYSPLRVGKDLDNPSQADFRFRGFDPAAGLSNKRLADRYQLLDRVEPRGPGRFNIGSDVRGFQAKAIDLVTGPEARRAFDLSHEKP
ncbi:MAG TPA: DUF1501 domain-containing protein, partial [Pirellulaceae bacterium]|nr:DUF1501 domain-containing protein [Pirellulaceae bacterium]